MSTCSNGVIVVSLASSVPRLCFLYCFHCKTWRFTRRARRTGGPETNSNRKLMWTIIPVFHNLHHSGLLLLFRGESILRFEDMQSSNLHPRVHNVVKVFLCPSLWTRTRRDWRLGGGAKGTRGLWRSVEDLGYLIRGQTSFISYAQTFASERNFKKVLLSQIWKNRPRPTGHVLFYHADTQETYLPTISSFHPRYQTPLFSIYYPKKRKNHANNSNSSVEAAVTWSHY